ncbi:hypothetical protein GCM10011534_35670 [Pseudooceanicola nanhaiensis]|jgi:hypothetical protein|uniref:Phospholipase D-like domain-containing protein n=2 Tax=Pseudooceanicola nanhaiensis TaxID=375761 RepID=A0A917T4B7_9RHOB|nr:hypothetical protein GCM10011534_35670 [Pseudooceanicola nanhaiensis]
MKYYEAFSGSGYDSAFMTTYAFSAQAFEDVPFPRLRGGGCRNITVLADRGMLNMSFDEFGPPRYAGTLYHVVKATMPGAFHPKIALLAGAAKGRLMIGSANLTGLGLGGNRELVADLAYTTDNPEFTSLFGQAMRYIARHVPNDDPWFSSALDRALRHASWLRTAMADESVTERDDIRLIIDRSEGTILDQIAASIGTDPIRRLIVLSPYWDERLEGLRRLRSVLGMPPTDILIQPAAGLFPAESLGRHDNLRLFNSGSERSSRFIHAKLFVALGEESDHLISGSMNCSAPALLGSADVSGNAEAGIYKRVPSGTALAALNLEGYEENPVSLSDLPAREERERSSSAEALPADAGNFELRGGELFWRPPNDGALDASEIRLFDRDYEELAQVLQIEAGGTNRWAIDPDLRRPRVARLVGHAGTWSAPASIVDLEILSSSTLPVRRGRKRTLVDSLAELDQEDLTILEALNELEMLEETEHSKNPGTVSSRSQTPTTQRDTEQLHQVLPYEVFVAARNRSRAEKDGRTAWSRAREDDPAGMINACLNRLVGLVSEDLSEDEERAMLEDAATDLRTTEPAKAEDTDAEGLNSADNSISPARRAHVTATAKKYVDAVKAFEKRTTALKGSPITTAELVRLRALLQIVLAGAMPVAGQAKEHQVLPLETKDSTEWPRLIGRLLRQHFGTIRALQSLQVEDDESEHTRVLDYLATAKFAAQMAVRGAQSSRSLAPIQKALGALSADLETQIKAIAASDEADLARLQELDGKLASRFGPALGI